MNNNYGVLVVQSGCIIVFQNYTERKKPNKINKLLIMLLAAGNVKYFTSGFFFYHFNYNIS